MVRPRLSGGHSSSTPIHTTTPNHTIPSGSGRTASAGHHHRQDAPHVPHVRMRSGSGWGTAGKIALGGGGVLMGGIGAATALGALNDALKTVTDVPGEMLGVLEKGLQGAYDGIGDMLAPVENAFSGTKGILTTAVTLTVGAISVYAAYELWTHRLF